MHQIRIKIPKAKLKGKPIASRCRPVLALRGSAANRSLTITTSRPPLAGWRRDPLSMQPLAVLAAELERDRVWLKRDGGSRAGGVLLKMRAGGGRPARMPRPYSQDLRDRVVASVAGGRSRRATAKIFSVSVATGVRWLRRFGTTGSVRALAMGGRRPYRLASRRDWLLARIAEKPDLTLRAVMAELAADGGKGSYGAVWGFFARA